MHVATFIIHILDAIITTMATAKSSKTDLIFPRTFASGYFNKHIHFANTRKFV